MTTTRDMSDRHETYLADLLDGRTTRGSGNQWHDQTDGKHTLYEQMYAFAWDGKATMAKSISVSLKMWEKLVEQARPHLPALPLRFYQDARARKVTEDLIVIRLQDFADLLHDANLLHRIKDQGCLRGEHDGGPVCAVCGTEAS